LFQGRFKAVLIKTNEQLLTVTRYIHLNPVKHGLVTDPAKYLWSSYRSFIGADPSFPWHTTDFTLSLFGEDPSRARRRFREFVLAGLEDDAAEDSFDEAEDLDFDEEELHDTPVEKPAKLRVPTLSFDEIQTRVCAVYEVSEQSLRSSHRTRRIGEARGALGWIASESGMSLSQTARFLGKDPSTMSMAARRFGERVRSSPDLKIRLESILEGLDNVSD
jgi:hypothetical protein